MVVAGIDVGGTFTDLVAVDEETGAIQLAKVPSTPSDEARAVLEGLEGLAPAHRVRRIVHGTTVATNAILQRRGARVGLVTTAGFRDLIEIGRTKRNLPALFNPRFVRPKPPVPRPLRFEVGERILHDGAVLHPLDEQEVATLCDRLRAAEVEAVAVCFLSSYANPDHERAAGEWIGRQLPGVPVSLSSEVVPEYREFERFSTTVFNAYIRPLMHRYLESLEKRLLAAGYPPGVLTVGSSGGALTVDAARRLPIKTLSSGPAGGVSQAVFVGRGIGRAGPHHLRHRGDEHGRLPGARPDPGRHHRHAPRRLPRQDAADRHQERRRRRRQHRVDRRGRRAPGRATVGRRRAGAGLLRARRPGRDRERRERRPRPAGRRPAARGDDPSGPGPGPEGHRAARHAARRLRSSPPGGRRGPDHAGPRGRVDPRDHDPARPRSRGPSR